MVNLLKLQHNVVICSENAVEHKKVPLGSFCDREGAFDRTSFEAIEKAAEHCGAELVVYRWITFMLESRNIIATLSGKILRMSTPRGCSQGSVLSPLLWRLMVNDFLWDSASVVIMMQMILQSL
jgi:hypothetical protein